MIRVPAHRREIRRLTLSAAQRSALRAARVRRHAPETRRHWTNAGVSIGFCALLAAAWGLAPRGPALAYEEIAYVVELVRRPAIAEFLLYPPPEPRADPPAGILSPESPEMPSFEIPPPSPARPPPLLSPMLAPTPARMPLGFQPPRLETPALLAAWEPEAAAPDVAEAGSNYWAAVRAAIAAKLNYPLAARRMGIEGVVSLRLTVDHAGELADASAVGTAPEILARPALEAARAAAPFPPPPSGPALRVTAVIPIRFELRAVGESPGDRRASAPLSPRAD